MVRLDDFPATLGAAQTGDGRAANDLFRTYQPMLLRYLRSQEREAADDIAAEVWLAAAGALHDFVGDEIGFRGWLFTVARRRVIEHRRRNIRRRTDSVDPAVFAETRSIDDPADRASESVDAQRAVDLMARHLSPDQTEVLLLRVVADLSAKQVAKLMDRPERWVRVTQHRALKRLADQMDRAAEVTT